MGTTAHRVLETIATQAGFYTTRDLFAAERWDAAAVALAVALEARPESAPLWYNLACAQARSGQSAKAVEALRRAVEAGFRDLAHLEADPDLGTIRREPGYRALVDELRAAAPPAVPTPASR
jgi:tetratricopeptide (TPR) repeat protein